MTRLAFQQKLVWVWLGSCVTIFFSIIRRSVTYRLFHLGYSLSELITDIPRVKFIRRAAVDQGKYILAGHPLYYSYEQNGKWPGQVCVISWHSRPTISYLLAFLSVALSSYRHIMIRRIIIIIIIMTRAVPSTRVVPAYSSSIKLELYFLSSSTQ